jgi:malic enzyme
MISRFLFTFQKLNMVDDPFRYIFPGLALGSALGQTGVVTNAMINRSAEALVELISEDDLKRRLADTN